MNIDIEQYMASHASTSYMVGQSMPSFNVTIPSGSRVTWGAGLPEGHLRYRHDPLHAPTAAYAPTAAVDVAHATSLLLNELLARLRFALQEYQDLARLELATSDHGQLEYRLETVDEDSRRLLSRIATVREEDHDVFVDYDEDPFFP